MEIGLLQTARALGEALKGPMRTSQRQGESAPLLQSARWRERHSLHIPLCSAKGGIATTHGARDLSDTHGAVISSDYDHQWGNE